MSGRCLLCGEGTGCDGDTVAISTPNGSHRAHRECMLRSVVGGIGHLTDHAHWCVGMHDPDGGRTYRQSALEVDAWVREHGRVAP